MPKPSPPLNIVLACLRLAQGFSQAGLAQICNAKSGLISDYERGRKPLSRDRVESLAAAMGLPRITVDITLEFLASLSSPENRLPLDSETQRIETIAKDWSRQTSTFIRGMLHAVSQESHAIQARQRAVILWAGLRKFDPDRRRLLLEDTAEFHTWALCERICEESVHSAPDHPDRALDLARLALLVAEKLPVDADNPSNAGERSRVQGYAWAHIGNARRARGDLSGADQALTHARKLWDAGASSAMKFLNEVQMISLEAFLRIEQLRLQQALALLDQGLASNPMEDLKDHLLINKAAALEFLGCHEEALATLEQMSRELDARLTLGRHFAWITNLCFLDRYVEAEVMLPELRGLAVRIGKDLDRVRCHWLEGRIAARLGKRQEAIEALSVVREEFASRGIAYETAQANLELAVLYLEEERNDTVKTLARQVAPILQAQGVHREALVALKLFRDAVEHDALTLDLSRQLAAFFQRARYNPELKFEEE